jgi:RHS repeat-associated protein
MLAANTLVAQDTADTSAQPAESTATDAGALTTPSDTTTPPDASGTDTGAQTTTQTVPTDLLPSSPTSGSTADILNFQTDLFSGRFSYHVPIVVPPARGNSQPSIMLGHSSAGGNGWCGVGWMLDMGFIQRDNRFGVPVAWSGTLPVNSYDETNGFVCTFGGVESRLVKIQQTGGDNEYRLESDAGSFLKFLWKSDGTWQAIDKGGNIFYFGTNMTSRMENPKFSGATVAQRTFRWALCQAVDPNGNKTVLSYTSDSNQLYLAQIQYNLNTQNASLPANTVDFILTNRNDVTVSFIPNYRVTTAKILKEIQVKANGQQVRKYVLTYTNSTSTTRSLLRSVTEYGTDFATALPSISFLYQAQTFGFASSSNWPGVVSQGNTDGSWNAIRSTGSGGDYFVEFMDVDADGLPDRVMRQYPGSPFSYFAMQRNTGSNFASEVDWSTLDNQGMPNDSQWNSVRGISSAPATLCDLLDINADGYPDRIERSTNGAHTNFLVQLTSGTPSFPTAITWGIVTSEDADVTWRSIRAGADTKADLVDMNGDGFPDRVMRRLNNPYDRFKVQLNTGSGFTGLVDWMGVNGQNQTNDTGWGSPDSIGSGATQVLLIDINGDGLPDRVMRKLNTPYTQFAVQFNNGVGFEAWEYWGGTLDSMGQTGPDWNSPVDTTSGDTSATLVDINGDGLVDRVMRTNASPYVKFHVQLNTGTGFAPAVDWTNVDNQGQSSSWGSVHTVNGGDTVVDLVDMNGDGLPDRVMRPVSAPFDHWLVQFNQGQFPDLMSAISNNLGGSVQISYTPSTRYDNRDRPWSADPWTAGAKSLLPQTMWTASRVIVDDGVGDVMTNSYAYAGGMFDFATKEFRGFNRVTVTDPLGGKSITYFHQGGGTNGTAMGEYNDAGSHAKKGIPYRIEVYGSDGNLYSVTINKVDEFRVHANGWYFGYIAQTIVQNFEGLGNPNNYRATAKQFIYDVRTDDLTSTGNLTEESNFGEVTSVNQANGGTFTDNPPSDAVYTLTHYTALANTNIKNKPDWIHTASDVNGSTVLRETKFTYNGTTGNLLTHLRLLGGTSYATNSIGYDTYGNPTSATDPAGITNYTTFDSTYQTFPIKTITGTFTNQTGFDVRSGSILTTTGPTGLVSTNKYDVFFRLTETDISTSPFGSPTLWRTKRSYNLGDARFGALYVHDQIYDPNDTNGIESYAYMDGFGRNIQTRAEAEGASGRVRVADTYYDNRGKVDFQTLPYFDSGWTYTSAGSIQLGSRTLFDPIGRVKAIYPIANMTGGPVGDTGSPVSSNTIAYVDGTTLWTTVSTDAENKIRKAKNDAYGRVVQVTDHDGNPTTYGYDLLGNLTNVTDSAGNKTSMSYDTIGRKISMTDPDMGTWAYSYDAASRLTNQVDAKGQKVKFYYNDEIGRLTKKELYNSAGSLVTNVTYVYDTNQGDSNYNVYKGQLFMVSDRQGTQKNSYDFRGRVWKSTRRLTVTATDYVVSNKYDEADRVTDLIYPGNAAHLTYGYDNVGHLTNVTSVCGTASNITFYSGVAFDELGRETTNKYWNGVQNIMTYYANSKRLQNLKAVNGGGTIQNLSYTFTAESDLLSIGDSVYSGSASASLSVLPYDNLHRLTGYVRNSATYTFSYNPVGNVTASSEGPSGTYNYPSAGSARPHAVTSIGGTKSYGYDSCGNMTNRNSWALSYDEENQLTQIVGTNTVTFGYADGGARLWKYAGGQYTIFIGGIYEIKASKTLCHVFAGGKRICTFEPNGAFCTWLNQHPWLDAGYRMFAACWDWPLKDGRAPLTACLIPLLGVLCASVVGRLRKVVIPSSSRNLCYSDTATVSAYSCFGFGSSLQRRHSRRWLDYLAHDPIASSPVRRFSVSAISVLLIVALFVLVTPTEVQAVTCSPVFWYYSGDHLGSSNILTDAGGNVVRHYEYFAFGKEEYNDHNCTFEVSNRYTGQVLDDETGLYYYGSRYYDPEIGRFIQPDTVVPRAGDLQALNRYSYVNNNPLKYIDPSGHIVDLAIAGSIAELLSAAAGGAAFSAAVSVTTAAAMGRDTGQAAETGAVDGALSGAFGFAGVVGAGALTAAMTRGDPGRGAAGAAAGYAIGAVVTLLTLGAAPAVQVVIAICSGALAGGVNSVIQGGNFGQGAASGAIGASVAFGIALAVSAAAPFIVSHVFTDHGAPTAGIAQTPAPAAASEKSSESPSCLTVDANSTQGSLSAQSSSEGTASLPQVKTSGSLSNTGGLTTAASGAQSQPQGQSFWQWLSTRNWWRIGSGALLVWYGNKLRGDGIVLAATGGLGELIPAGQIPATTAIVGGISLFTIGAVTVGYGVREVLLGFGSLPP